MPELPLAPIDLHEDDVERDSDGLGWLDTEISDSFPASDPLSHWAGPSLGRVPL